MPGNPYSPQPPSYFPSLFDLRLHLCKENSFEFWESATQIIVFNFSLITETFVLHHIIPDALRRFHAWWYTMQLRVQGVISHWLLSIAFSATFSVFDSIDDDVLLSYQEFQLANTLYYTMKENYTSEQGARMVSMDGASKNAGKMLYIV